MSAPTRSGWPHSRGTTWPFQKSSAQPKGILRHPILGIRGPSQPPQKMKVTTKGPAAVRGRKLCLPGPGDAVSMKVVLPGRGSSRALGPADPCASPTRGNTDCTVPSGGGLRSQKKKEAGSKRHGLGTPVSIPGDETPESHQGPAPATPARPRPARAVTIVGLPLPAQPHLCKGRVIHCIRQTIAQEIN